MVLNDSLPFFFAGSVSAVAAHPPRCVLQRLRRNLSDLHIAHGTTLAHTRRHTNTHSQRLNEQQNRSPTDLLFLPVTETTWWSTCEGQLVVSAARFQSIQVFKFLFFQMTLSAVTFISPHNRGGVTYTERKISVRHAFARRTFYGLHHQMCHHVREVQYHTLPFRRIEKKEKIGKLSSL